METNRKYQKIQEIAGLSVGAFQGGASGAFIGSQIVPGIGTAIGALVGAGASAIGGASDMIISDKLHNEALDYKNDMFGYRLDSIKALPYSI